MDCSVDGDVILKMKSDDLKGGVGALVMTQKFIWERLSIKTGQRLGHNMVW